VRKEGGREGGRQGGWRGTCGPIQCNREDDGAKDVRDVRKAFGSHVGADGVGTARVLAEDDSALKAGGREGGRGGGREGGREGA
jgi:hypothetical protein